MPVRDAYTGTARRNTEHRGPINNRERLLVVDDGAEARAMLSDYLDRLGYRAQLASSRAQALAMLHGGLQVDAIVYDATMPVMGGSAFVRQLHSDANATPVLLMTGARGAADKSADAPDAAIAKPFQLVDFGDTLLRMLTAARPPSRRTVPAAGGSSESGSR
jgi:two-component system, NarL family, capsular synthesis sensor histidine kinase RcsC